MSVRGRLEVEWRRAQRVAGDYVVEATLAAMHLRFGPRPAPLSAWKRALAFNRAVAGRTLVRAIHKLDLRTDRFPAEVAVRATTATLSPWAIDAATARWLWQEATLRQPRVVLECGAGESTVLFATFLAGAPAAAGHGPPCVVALEHDAEYAAGIRERVSVHGWANLVHVHLAPLAPDGSYTLVPFALAAVLGGRRADWILVDGPPDNRTLTVPSLAAYARAGTRWFLDDAFDPAFFAALQRWTTWPGLRVDGIIPIGKGLGVGTITDPAAAAAHRPT